METWILFESYIQFSVLLDRKHLSRCDLETSYGDRDLSQIWPRRLLFAWRYQAVTWFNVELSQKVLCDIHLRAISQQVAVILIDTVCSETTYLKLSLHLPGTLISIHSDRSCGSADNFEPTTIFDIFRYSGGSL